LRGRLFTDDEGRFEVRTILPEGYLLAPGYRRAKHVHLKVSHPDVAGVLTTQIYFAKDPYNATDPFVVPSLIVELVPDDEAAAHGDAALVARFDIVV
jgi:protocatechuate 3,4-dioxygenase beta subunit